MSHDAPARFELSQEFFFDAAHKLERTVDPEPGRRIHGHTYLARVHVAGEQDLATGMVVDLGLLRSATARVREQLDHRLLDEVPGLGTTSMENLCRYIWRQLAGEFPSLEAVEVARGSTGDSCMLRRA